MAGGWLAGGVLCLLRAGHEPRSAARWLAPTWRCHAGPHAPAPAALPPRQVVEGQLKLIDFGIAKAIHGGAPGGALGAAHRATRAGPRMLVQALYLSPSPP